MSGTTFIPESGLTTENNVQAQSMTTPKRTAPSITAPPAVLKEADKMSEELSALGSSIESRGHPVGRYNSFFYELLTWKHPRASGLILTTLLSSIIFTQFVNVPKFLFRGIWIGLATTTALEVAGRFVFQSNEGLVSQFAPREYFTVSRESLDPIFNEVYSLVNFAVVEAQRLLFVRNVRHTSAAFVLSFVAYNLIKFLPLWALTMIGIVLSFALPPVYLQNQQLIDAKFNQASELGSAHYQNAVNVASKHATAASEKARLTAIDLGNKAGVNVNQYISGPGPVQSQSALDNLAKQTKINTNTTSTVTPSTNGAATTSGTAHTSFSETTTTSSFVTEPEIHISKPTSTSTTFVSTSTDSIHAAPDTVASSVVEELSNAPALPKDDGVYVSGQPAMAI